MHGSLSLPCIADLDGWLAASCVDARAKTMLLHGHADMLDVSPAGTSATAISASANFLLTPLPERCPEAAAPARCAPAAASSCALWLPATSFSCLQAILQVHVSQQPEASIAEASACSLLAQPLLQSICTCHKDRLHGMLGKKACCHQCHSQLLRGHVRASTLHAGAPAQHSLQRLVAGCSRRCTGAFRVGWQAQSE